MVKTTTLEAAELSRLSASEAARGIARGELTSSALIEACLARVAAREPAVGAWQFIDHEAARAAARACDVERPRGPLHGVPVGIKDIFDTLDMPTEYGSPIYAGHRPRVDAASVARLRGAGAILLGKTVTTEFAYFTPGKTANPRNLAHTPGGSSSGSAAAVADDMIPLAIGSQTAGSVIRPAAFCGVVGFKPSHGLIAAAGAKALAPSLDTVGGFARSVEDVELLARLLMGEDASMPELAVERPRRIGFCRTDYWTRAEPATETALNAVASALKGLSIDVIDLDLPESCLGLGEAQFTVMAFEARLSFAAELRDRGDQLSPKLRELLESAQKISDRQYEAALRQAAQARAAWDGVFNTVDAVLTPSAPGEAPVGIGATGDPVFNRIWTLLHVPCITLPVAEGPNGLPIGAQLVGRYKHDHTLLALARWVEAELG